MVFDTPQIIQQIENAQSQSKEKSAKYLSIKSELLETDDLGVSQEISSEPSNTEASSKSEQKVELNFHDLQTADFEVKEIGATDQNPLSLT